MTNAVGPLLLKSLPATLVEQLLETFGETRRNFYLARFRPSEVEGGRFAEAVFRILEYKTTGGFTPLGVRIPDFEKRCEDLRNLPVSSFSDSVRIHIPRTIRLVYDIRNKRDAAHLADGIDPNLQDASFVVACCDWVMAELVRIFRGVDANEAHRIVTELVTRRAPVIQEFGEELLKTLNPRLGPTDRVLVLLYHRGDVGATEQELASWLKPVQRKNIGRVLSDLEHEKDFIVSKSDKYFITLRGVREVEQKRLSDSPN